ncbi:MAG: nucleotidyltransferase family protein [Bacteroidales bacterium]|nr:nucleotidyltransferase family protein [Bacteroidales bacterium]MCB9029018.1 nucleotidyltransferase family protein [Bacteroidales bacterium]HPJ06377.1 nucleotidyltransferase family protein [Bacteroidales bacterium]HPQ65079.1 nucleotidyltransferase family protein [Bacteroidales bacterium]
MNEPEDTLVILDNDELMNAVRLLLLLGRTDFTADERQQITDEFERYSSWNLFVSLAVRHGVAALVWQNVSDLGLAHRVPEAERTMLEGLRFKSIARVTWITEAAAAVCGLLEREGIRVVALKGLALEHTVYGSRGLRQMSDADLLVAPSDALRARDILVRDGFRSMRLKSPLYRHIILDLGNHLPELHRGGVSVDLHYRLFGPEAEEMVVRAIADSETITAGKSTLRVLPPMTAFLALVGHIYKHGIKGEFQMRLWTDIYLLLARDGEKILTPELPAAAEEAGIAGETGTVLTVMEKVWGVKMPAEIRPLLDDPREGAGTPEDNRVSESVTTDRPEDNGRSQSVACETAGVESGEAIIARFMRDLMHPGAVESISQREMFTRNLEALRSPGKKLIFILGDIFPSVGFMKRRYGCRSTLKAVLFYPHRLGKLGWILGIRGDKSPGN